MLHNIKTNPDFSLVTRKQVDKASAKTIMAAVYRTPYRRGFDYAIEVTRSVQAPHRAMVDIESLSVDARSIDSLIAELIAAKAIIEQDMKAFGNDF